MDTTYQKNIDEIYDSLINMLGDDKIKMTNILKVTIHLMKFSEKFDKMSGLDKKAAVIHVIKKYVSENKYDDEEGTINVFIDLVLPDLIDDFISFDQGKIKIKTQRCEKFCFCM